MLADDGTLWLNLGDSYASSGGTSGVGPNAIVGSTLRQNLERTRPASALPAKNLLGMPWRVAFALQDDSWILRNDVIWAKPNGMPESVTDRLSTKHEHLFLFAKSQRYHFDLDAIREPAIYPADHPALDWARDSKEAVVPASPNTRQHRSGRTWKERKAAGAPSRRGINPIAAVGDSGFAPGERGKNPGDVWAIPTQPFPGAHFACMPLDLAKRCVATSKPDAIVLDPFSGSGTTGLAAAQLGRRYIGIDNNAEYLDLSLTTRLAQPALIATER